MVNKLKISLCISGHVSNRAPEIKVYHNDNTVCQAKIDQQHQWIEFFITPESKNKLSIDFYNKTPENTIVEQGNIVSDMSLELHKIRIDDILLQTWFLNDGHYNPRYFTDFLTDFPDSPTTIKSQQIWHFPGSYHLLEFPEDIWTWYHRERTSRITLDNMDKDLHRWEKFVGSAEKYTDIVDKIKELINAT